MEHLAITTKWGSMPVNLPNETDLSIAAIEMEQITKPRLVKVDGPKFFNPVNEDDRTENPMVEGLAASPNLIYSIQLMQFLSKLKSVSDESEINPSLLEIPTPPICPVDRSSQRDMLKCNFSENTIREFIRRSIILICVYSGYDATKESVMDTLVEICSDYLSRICKLFSYAVESKKFSGKNDFIDITDKVLKDTGLSLVALQNFENSINTNKNNLLKEVTRRVNLMKEPRMMQMRQSESYDSTERTCVMESEVKMSQDGLLPNIFLDIPFGLINGVIDATHENSPNIS